MSTSPVVQLSPIQTTEEADGSIVVSAIAQGVVDASAKEIVSAISQSIVDASAKEIVSAIAEGIVDTSAEEIISSTAQGTALADAEGNALTRVVNKAHTQPGGLDIQIDGVSAGGSSRPNINFTDTDNAPLHPVGTQQATNVDIKFETPERGPAGFLLPELDTLAVQAGIDGTVIDDIIIFTVPSNQEAIILGAVVICETATAITAPPTAGIGIGTGIDDIFGSQELTGLTSADLAFSYPEGGTATIATEGDTIIFGIDIGASGTSQTLRVHLIGYLRTI